jgi:hypothetical protein
LAAPPAQPATDRLVPVAFVAHTWYSTQDGPALSAMCQNGHSVWRIAPNGDVFVLDPAQHQIFVYVRKEERVYTLCTGTPGCLDGVAGEAQAAMSFGDRTYPGLCFDPKGRAFFSNNTTGQLRMIDRGDDGRWHLTTVAGRGSRKPESIPPGETVAAEQVGVLGTAALAAGADGTVYIGTHQSCFFTLKDGRMTRLKTSKRVFEVNHIGVTDAGDIFVLGGRNHYVKIGKDGEVVFLGGYGGKTEFTPPDWTGKPPGYDGPALQANYWCPGLFKVAPDGSALYVGGGDEDTIRRIKPPAPDGRVCTLMTDGSWKECGKFKEPGQWRRPPGFHFENGFLSTDLRTGQVELTTPPGEWFLGDASGAWLLRPEGPQVEKIRKAFGPETGGGK